MNRAERRRKEKEEKKKSNVLCLTEEQFKARLKEELEQVKPALVEQVTGVVLDQYLVLTMGVLFDKFDFTREQLLEYKQRLEDLSDCINEDYVTVDDYKLILADEAGITFYNSSCGDNDVERKDNSITKVDKYKEHIRANDYWFMFICVMKVLREYFGFARKRGNLFVEALVKVIKECKNTESETFKNMSEELRIRHFGEAIKRYDYFQFSDRDNPFRHFDEEVKKNED